MVVFWVVTPCWHTAKTLHSSTTKTTIYINKALKTLYHTSLTSIWLLESLQISLQGWRKARNVGTQQKFHTTQLRRPQNLRLTSMWRHNFRYFYFWNTFGSHFRTEDGPQTLAHSQNSTLHNSEDNRVTQPWKPNANLFEKISHAIQLLELTAGLKMGPKRWHTAKIPHCTTQKFTMYSVISSLHQAARSYNTEYISYTKRVFWRRTDNYFYFW